MKKKRALRILSLILLCALTFTACKKNVGTPEDNAASKDENTEEKDLDKILADPAHNLERGVVFTLEGMKMFVIATE